MRHHCINVYFNGDDKSVRCYLTFISPIFGSSNQRRSIKIGAFKNFTKFTGTHLCQSLFFNKVAGLATLFYRPYIDDCFRIFPSTSWLWLWLFSLLKLSHFRLQGERNSSMMCIQNIYLRRSSFWTYLLLLEQARKSMLHLFSVFVTLSMLLLFSH